MDGILKQKNSPRLRMLELGRTDCIPPHLASHCQTMVSESCSVDKFLE